MSNIIVDILTSMWQTSLKAAVVREKNYYVAI